MSEVEAWYILTTSNASSRPTLEFSMHHFSFNCVIDAKPRGKVIPDKPNQKRRAIDKLQLLGFFLFIVIDIVNPVFLNV